MNRRHKAVLALALIAAGIALIMGQGFHVFVGMLAVGVAFAWLIGSDTPIIHGVFVAVGVSLIGIPLLIGGIVAWRDNAEHEKTVRTFKQRLPSLRVRFALPERRTFGSVGDWALHLKPDGSDLSIGPNEPWGRWQVVSRRPVDSVPSFDPPWPCYIPREARQRIRSQLEGALQRNEIEPLLKPGLLPKIGPSGAPDTLPADFFENLDKGREVVKDILRQLDNADRYPVPDWFEDAVRAGVDTRQIPDEDKPPDGPTRFDFAGVLVRSTVFLVSGSLFLGTGIGCILHLRRRRTG